MDSCSQIFSYTFSKQTRTFGKQNFYIKLKTEPLDITVVGNLEIAVLQSNQITRYSIDECVGFRREVTLSSLHRIQYALSFSRNFYFLAQVSNNALIIAVLNSDGHLTDTIDVCKLRNIAINDFKSSTIDVQLTVRGSIYCSVYDPAREGIERNIVYCFDERQRNILWQFSDKCLGRLSGITTDQSRNVYVTNGNHLTVISDNGKSYKTLLNDILPSSDVCFDDEEQCMVLCSDNGTSQILHMAITCQ